MPNVAANLIGVTLTVRSPDGTTTDQAVNCVHKQPDTLDNTVGGTPAVMEAEVTTFRMWAVRLAGTVPRKGFKITLEDGTRYSITRVETLTHGRSFRCRAR